MQRRDFIGLVSGAIAWPVAARAQQRTTPVVGLVLTSKSREPAFLEGLARAGYVENRNVVVERRWHEGYYERFPDIMAELVARRVDVIAVLAVTSGALAAKAATQTIPIVFMTGSDPVEVGLVAGLAHPGGNLTGVYLLQAPVIAKRVDFLHQLMPATTTIGLLTDPANSTFGLVERGQVEIAARSLGLELRIVGAKDEDEIDACFPNLVAQGIHALVIGADPFFFIRRAQIAELCLRYGVRAIGGWREYADVGGLMSYGTNSLAAYRLAGNYVSRILAGEKPADMPVEQVTNFELVINLKAAKALELTIPDGLLAVVDAVIE